MNILFFSTKANAAANLHAEPESQAQPSLNHVGAILCGHDKRTVAEMNLIVKPGNWEIPTQASKVHGITTELARTYGMNPVGVLRLFVALCDRADLLVAYHAENDRTIIRSALAWLVFRQQLPAEDLARVREKNCYSVIRELPGNPRIQDAHIQHCGLEFEAEFDAMADVRATQRIFWAINKAPEPGEAVEL